MALTNISGASPYWPEIPSLTFGNNATMMNRTQMTIDATGEKAAMIGRFWHPSGPGTYNIRKVGIVFGTVVKAGGSVLTLSLQDVSLTAGPPIQPDETQDQTVTIANAAATFASNTYHLTGALSADRAQAHGGLLSVVVEFDAGGRLGVDSVGITQLVASLLAAVPRQTACSLKTASWGLMNHFPVVFFECDDGSIATFDHTLPCSTTGATALNTGTTPDEYALRFYSPVEFKADSAWIVVFVNAATDDLDVVFYQGTTALETVSIDANAIRATGVYQAIEIPFSAVRTIAANTEYNLSVKPMTANSVTVPYVDVPSNAHLAVWPWGINSYLQTRVDAGVWSADTARTIWGGLGIRAMHAAGGGGGVLIPGGMSGGFRG